jgi:hypothetical protein
VQAPKPAPSSWQRKLTPASLSENANVALAELLGSGGPESIVGVGGGCVSTVQERVAGALSLPKTSRAFTWKLWLPSARPP